MVLTMFLALERGFHAQPLGALRNPSFQVGLIACALHGDISQLSRHRNPFPASLRGPGPLMLREECNGMVSRKEIRHGSVIESLPSVARSAPSRRPGGCSPILASFVPLQLCKQQIILAIVNRRMLSLRSASRIISFLAARDNPSQPAFFDPCPIQQQDPRLSNLLIQPNKALQKKVPAQPGFRAEQGFIHWLSLSTVKRQVKRRWSSFTLTSSGFSLCHQFVALSNLSGSRSTAVAKLANSKLDRPEAFSLQSKPDLCLYLANLFSCYEPNPLMLRLQSLRFIQSP